MPTEPTPDPQQSTSGWLEDLVASALEVLDRAGEDGLEELLAQHPQHRQQVLDLVARFRGTGLLARDARDQIPQRLGEFRLLEKLGSGGMGVVFLAEQESLQRTVALKVIRPDLVFFAGTRERFRREIEVIARLAHPAIVPIVATGEHEGMPWYAMPRIVGCTVDEAVRRLRGREPASLRGSDLEAAICQGLPDVSSEVDRSVFTGAFWQACVRLIRHAALGLEHAHREGVVHRDVKPSNVMLTPDGRALLLDFGLARTRGDAKLTRTGGEPGSPAYMAPEQVRGLGADERADVYSLAATLFQLLELEAPFHAPDAEALRTQILQGKRGGLRNRALPPELRHVVAVAMDVDRERRYPTAAAFVADLDAVLARKPILARRLPLHVRALRWAQRHRTAASALGALTLLAIVVPAVVAWQRGVSLAAVRVEKVAAEKARDQALTAVREFLTELGSGPMLSQPGVQRMAGNLLDRAIAQLESMPADIDPFVMRQHRTHVQRYRVSTLAGRGQTKEAVELARALIAEWHGGTPTPSMAFLLASLRVETLRLAVDGEPVPDLDELLAPCEAELVLAATAPALVDGAAHVRASLAMHQAARADHAGEAERGERLLAAAIARGRPAGPDHVDDDTLCVLLVRDGDMLLGLNRLDDAQARYRETVTLLTPATDPALGSPDQIAIRAHATWGLGRVEFHHQRWDASSRLLHAAADLFEHGLYAFPDGASGAVRFASVLTELAQVERQRGADAAAILAMLERAQRLFEHRATDVQRDPRSRASAIVNAHVLTLLRAAAHDPDGLAAAARRLAALAPDAAPRLAHAAWCLLNAAAWFAERGDDAAAGRCDDDAMAALVACDAAGWFPPIHLDDAPCQRLHEHAEFARLRAAHPPEQARRPPR